MILKTFTKKSVLFLSVLSAMPMAYANYLSNYGEPNTANLVGAIANHSLHVVQLGDSHTAGDTMTEALRSRLQSVLGDGGMGWAMPMYFSGQRMARFGYDNTNFMPVSSRSNTGENYTIGGMIAKPKSIGATLTLKAKRAENPQKILISIRQASGDGKFVATDANGERFAVETPYKNGAWQMVSINAKLPLTIYNESANNSAIGGWWAFNQNRQGAVVSALGINGAELSYWNRWNETAWQNELKTINPQLIVIAYGTNEAYNGVDAQSVKNHLQWRVRQIRQQLPQTAIVIMGAPEALKSTAGGCGTRPATLNAIQQVQREVAQSERTLYWDWQAAMGGSCSMKSWINSGKASRDGVHFSAAGYTTLGTKFADDLLALSSGYHGSHTNYASTQSVTMPAYVPASTPNLQPSGSQGFIRIQRANP